MNWICRLDSVKGVSPYGPLISIVFWAQMTRPSAQSQTLIRRKGHTGNSFLNDVTGYDTPALYNRVLLGRGREIRREGGIGVE